MRLVACLLVLGVGCGDNHGATRDASVDSPADASVDASELCASPCDDGDACTADVCVKGTCHNTARATCGEAPDCASAACAMTDDDADGIDDVSEARGYLDSNCNGVDDGPMIDLRLPGAVVGRKTIYVEYDYMAKPGTGTACTTDADCSALEACECPMTEPCAARACQHSHRPRAAAPRAIVAAFAAKNIDLIFDPSPTKLPETDVVTYGTLATNCAGPSASNFFTLKTANFDPRKRWVSHYAIFGHYATCNSGVNCSMCPPDPISFVSPPFGATGTAEILGNDFIVTMARMYSDFNLPRTLANEAGTIMHELGHNLGLLHGGHEPSPEGKPNYFSIMNRAFQFTGITSAANGLRVDYSGAVLATIDESSLLESAGLDEAGADPLHGDDISHITNGLGIDADAPGTGAIDWDGDGSISTTALTSPVDVNSDGSYNMMVGSNDWARIVLPFACEASGIANGYVPSATVQESQH